MKTIKTIQIDLTAEGDKYASTYSVHAAQNGGEIFGCNCGELYLTEVSAVHCKKCITYLDRETYTNRVVLRFFNPNLPSFSDALDLLKESAKAKRRQAKVLLSEARNLEDAAKIGKKVPDHGAVLHWIMTLPREQWPQLVWDSLREALNRSRQKNSEGK